MIKNWIERITIRVSVELLYIEFSRSCLPLVSDHPTLYRGQTLHTDSSWPHPRSDLNVQDGFIPARSAFGHISALQLLIEKFREYWRDRHLYVAFIDLKATFDKADTVNILIFPLKLPTLFTMLYDGAGGVQTNGNMSDWFLISASVRRGCVVDPDLFNCIINHLMDATTSMVTTI